MALSNRKNRRRSRGSASRQRRSFQCERLEPRILLAEASGLFNDSVLMRSDRRSVPVPTFNSGYTVEAWVRRADGNRCETIISSGYDSFFASQGFWFGVCGGGLPSFQSNTGLTARHDGFTFIPANVWTHLAATWSSSEERLYVNGELDSVHVAGVEPNRGQNYLYVGAWNDENRFFGGPSFEFLGNISEARVWQRVRSQDEIRRSMHELLEGRPTDLLATWHLNTNFNESVNNFPTTNTNPCICGPAAPPVWRVSEVNANFNRLSSSRFFGAGASVPATNTAYLIGGYDLAPPYRIRNDILSMDMSTGDVATVASLPAGVGSQAAAYAPVNNSIYIFGGEIFNAPQNTITKYDLTTNSVTQLGATLPTALYFGNAVWHPGIKRIVLVGGINGVALNSIVLFDPVTETASLAAVALPAGRYNAAVGYSPLTDRVYVFGGNDNNGFTSATRTVFELAINADGSGAAGEMPAAELPLAHTFATAVRDPESHLIHILGGTAEYVQTFDPRTGKSWRTTIRMPRNYNGNPNGAVLNTPYQTVVYSPSNRHALVIGGGNYGAAPTSKVWRVPLGDGPAVPIERWDFINSVPTIGSEITEIDGDDRGVYFAGPNGGDQILGIDENGTTFLYNPPGFNGSVNDIAVNPGGLWAGYSSGGGAWEFSNGTAQQYGPAAIGANNVYSVQPDFLFLGTDQGLKSPTFFGWQTTLHPNSFDYVGAQTGSGRESWAVVRNQPPDSGGGAGPWRLGHVVADVFGGTTAVEFPSVCGDDIFHAPGGLSAYHDITQDEAGNLWIVGRGRGPEAICYVPKSSLAGTPIGSLVTSLNGNLATSVDVDADNRVWVGLGANSGMPGGLTPFDANVAGTLKTTDYNWTNAPIGSRRSFFGGPEPVWNSSVTAVAAVDEKVYAAKAAGGVATVAQRWQQLDDILGNSTVSGVWTAAGRTFFALPFSLYVLEPDGITFSHHDLSFRGNAHAVTSDGAGRIWIGTDAGPWLYTPSGLDDMSSRLGTRPAGRVNAIVEAPDLDLQDREAAPVWIGGNDGLTLFDRNRFVTTFTTANSELPANTVQSILVDRAGNLWAGTTAGLARLSPDRTTWTTFTTADGLPNNSIFDLVQLADGRIAVSTANGLSLYNGTTFITQSPPVTAINLPLSVDDLSRLWAGSAVLTAAGWRGYWSTNSGLKYSTISDTATDGADRIWFSHAPNPGVSVRGTFLPPLKDFAPRIDSYAPASGTSGDLLTLTGVSLGSDPDELNVTVGGSTVTVISASETQVIVQLNDTATSGQVSLTRGGRRATAPAAFCAVPQYRSHTPIGASIGVQLDVLGTNLDADATIRIGNGPVHRSNTGGLTMRSTIVEAGDATGQIVVENHCAGATATSGLNFRKIDLAIPTIAFNQGMPSSGIIEDKATLIQNFISAGGPLVLGERVEIDEVREFITDRNGSVRRFDTRLDNAGVTPTLIQGATPTDAERLTIATSQNVPNMFFTESGQNTVRTVLMRRGRTVAEATTTVNATPNQALQVLLVPIMRDNADLRAMITNVENDLAQVRERIFPFGTANIVWADEVIRRNETFTLDNFFNLYYAAPGLDRIRRRHNEDPNRPDAQIVMGVIEPTLASGSSRPGFAFGADISKLLNTLVLDELDSLCDAVNGVVNTITFGLLGSDDGCKLDIPLYVGWMTGTTADGLGTSPGQTMAHEIGHTLGLVKPWASNGAWLDNLSHSVNDELPADMECNNRAVGAFDWNKSFHMQPGVNRPIVNPINAFEFLPINDGDPTNTSRAKAMMAYACNTNAANSFFEPVDATEMNHPLIPLIADMIKLAKVLSGNSPSAPPSNGSPTASPAASQSPSAPISPARAPAAAPDTTGPRLHVFGTLDTTADTGELFRVESYGETGPLTPSFATGYWLVQLDAAGNELARTGVAPLGSFDEEPAAAAQFVFSATLRRHDDTVRLQLRHGATVLDDFAPGGAAPVAQIVQPAVGGFYQTGPVTVEWTATDADGDLLEVAIEYSPDDGASWKTIGSATGSGSLNVPLETLAVRNGGPGRFRVIASDGLLSGIGLSPEFGVANQRPQVTIDATLNGATVLEGKPVVFTGSVFDAEDGPLGATNLSWHSTRDGVLGSGAARLTTATLSVGFHGITLLAVDSGGQTTAETIYVTVAGDYDFDGIDDASEAASMLNPLTSMDAYSDADGDGLTLLVERQIGSNPTSIDSDGDGRRDDVELVDGTDSTAIDNPPAADALMTTIADLSLSIDLAANTPLPQFNLGVTSRQPADWELITDVDWLEATAAGGTTPGTTLVRVQAFKLTNGTHLAHLRFNSETIGDSAIIPLTVTVTNRGAYFDIDENGTAGDADCQAVQATIGLTFADAGYDLSLDIDRDGVIESEDVGTCNTAVGSTPLQGDFDQDGDEDADDIDLFIVAPFIDFNGDAQMDAADVAYVVETIFRTHFGDANLDGFVNRADAAIVTSNLGWTGGAAWARGNFNGDARVDLVDLAIQQANYGANPAPAPAAQLVRATQFAGRGVVDQRGQVSRLVSDRQVNRVTPANVSNSPTTSPSTLSASRRPRWANRLSGKRLDTIVDEFFAASNEP